MPEVPNVKNPFGAADVLTLTAAVAAQALTIENNVTLIDGVTNVASVARTLNLTITESVNTGAEIILKTKTTATENTVFGTGATGTTYAGVAGKTITRLLKYDGSSFLVTNEQID